MGVAFGTDTMVSYAFKSPNEFSLMNRTRLERATISESNVKSERILKVNISFAEGEDS